MHACQLVSRPEPPEPVRTTTLPTGPWRDLAVDLLGPLPTGVSILEVVDYYSRYYEIDIMKSTVASRIIESLEEMFSRHGLPESMTSDNGPQFIASEFAAYMEHQGIRHHRVTAKWPQANGEVEGQNRSLLKRIQIEHAEKKNWKKELKTYLVAYRSLPHPTTGVSPAELLFGRKIRTRLPELNDVHVEHEVRDKDSEQKSKGKAYADAKRNARYSEVVPGDQVLVQQERQDKLSPQFNPTPYTVVTKRGNSLVVQSQEGAQYSRNTSHVKKFLQDNSAEHQEEAETEPSSTSEESNQRSMEMRTEQNTSSPKEDVAVRRSKRQKKKPSYLVGYTEN